MATKKNTTRTQPKDFSKTREEKAQDIKNEISFLEETMGNNNTKIIDEPVELTEVQKRGRAIASADYRPEGGWREGLKFEDYPELSKVEFNLFNDNKIHPLEAVSLKKLGLLADELGLKQCIKFANYHRDALLIKQSEKFQAENSFSPEEEDRVAKAQHQRLVGLRNNKNRTTKEQHELEHLEKMFKEAEEDEKIPMSSIEAYKEGEWLLNQAYKEVGGVHLYHDGNGIFCGLHIGLQDKCPEIKGINTPEDFKIIKALRYIDFKLATSVTHMPEKVRDYWMPILSGNGLNSLISTSLFMFDIPKEKSISIDGNLAWASVPKLDWFDERLQEIDPLDLLAFLPKPEANALLIHLGKLATGYSTRAEGRKMSPVVELPLDYTYRMMPVLCGSPGIGKSTFLEYLAYSIGKVGYSSDVLSQTLNQFAWEGTTKNLLYIDDMTPESMIALLKSANAKTLASNGVISTQKKGQQLKSIHSQCSVVLACNIPAFPKNLDPGMFDRLYVMQTYTKMQMSALSKKSGKNMLTKEHWEGLATELKIDVEAIVLYLIRHGLDRFLASIDVQKIDGIWIQGTDKSKIAHILNAYKAEFQYKLPVEMVDNLTASSRRALLFSQKMDENMIIPEFYEDSFSAFTLLHTFKLCTEIYKQKQAVTKQLKDFVSIFDENPGTKLYEEKVAGYQIKLDALDMISTWIDCKIQPHIMQQYLTVWHNKLNSNINNDVTLGTKSGLDFEGIWDTMISCVTTKGGLKVEKERSVYEVPFESCKKDAEGYLVEFNESLDELFARYKGVLVDEVLTWEALTGRNTELKNLNLAITSFVIE